MPTHYNNMKKKTTKAKSLKEMLGGKTKKTATKKKRK